MPIRFRCVYCGQLLSIATRKIGTQIDCPKCSHPNVVPQKDEDPPEEKKPKVAKVSRAFESSKFDRWLGRGASPVPEEVDEPSTGLGEAVAISQPSDPGASESSSAVVEERWRGVPETLPTSRPADSADGSLSPRVAGLFIAAAVLLLLAAFALGVLVGRYALPATAAAGSAHAEASGARAPDDKKDTEQDLAEAAAANAGIELTGLVQVTHGEQDASADEGAVVLLLPVQSIPPADARISLDGLRPGEGGGKGESQLREWGGEVARVGRDGEFHLPIPKPGTFWVVVFSNGAKTDPDRKLRQSEVDTLKQYFDDPASLMKEHEYILVTRKVKVGQPVSPIKHQFTSAK